MYCVGVEVDGVVVGGYLDVYLIGFVGVYGVFDDEYVFGEVVVV